MKGIRKIGEKFFGLSMYSKIVLVLCAIIMVTSVYLCNSIMVYGEQKEISMKEVDSMDAIVTIIEKEENLKKEDESIAIENIQQPVEMQEVEQPVEKQEAEQLVEKQEVEQPSEIQQIQQVEETGQIQQVEEIGQELVNSTNIHKNSINGIEYKLMNQADAEWKDVKYPTRSGTIGKVGCMITSVAVVSSAYDKTMTPKKVMDAGYQHNYPSDSIPRFSANNFTCTMSSSSNKNTIIDNLKQGNVVVIKVKSASKFTGSQHYMALIDISSDGRQIFVGNSYDSGKGTYNRTGWFDTDTVLYDIHEVHIAVPSQELINQYK